MSASSLVVAVVVAVAVVCARGGRVASASRTRHRATSPSRRHASSPSQPPQTCTPLIRYSYFERRNVAFHFSFSLYDVLVLLYLYYFRRFHFAWPRGSLHSRRIIQRIRRAAAPSVIEFHHYVFAERSRRIYVAL